MENYAGREGFCERRGRGGEGADGMVGGCAEAWEREAEEEAVAAVGEGSIQEQAARKPEGG